MENKSQKVFLEYLHSFRGLAIILIVLLHSTYSTIFLTNQLGSHKYFEIITQVLLHGSTIFFAVISGILFSNILRNRGFKRFYISKTKYVILPYLLFTIVLTLVMVKFKVFANDGYLEALLQYIKLVFENFIYGEAHYIYWYIPVLMFLYLVTPFLDYIQKANTLSKVLFVIFMVLPLFFSRMGMSFQTMVYFMGCYCFGMYLGDNLEMKLNYFKKHIHVITIIAIVSTISLFYLYWNDMDLVGNISLKESFFYIQKTSFTLIIILFFKQLHEQPKWLDGIARDSFAIYFLHGPILFILNFIFSKLIHELYFNPIYIILLALLLFFLAISISMLIVYVFRRIFGKKSRMLIGS